MVRIAHPRSAGRPRVLRRDPRLALRQGAASGAATSTDYTMVLAGSEPVGGMLALSEAMRAGGAAPGWVAYVCVDDLAEACAGVRGAGGKVLMEGLAIEGVGPFALAADPEGQPFYCIEDRSGRPSGAYARYAPAPGTCAWNELAARDPDRALGFYRGLFGWRQEGALEMGEMGSYRFIQHTDYALGAVMPTGDAWTEAGWTFYFRVGDIDAAARTLAEGGGTVVQEPQEIPGGDYALVARDPQSARFGLVGPRIV